MKNYLFFYKNPPGRMPDDAMLFGWQAIWGGGLYGNSIELELSKSEDLADDIVKILATLQINMQDNYKVWRERGGVGGGSVHDPRFIEARLNKPDAFGYCADTLEGLLAYLRTDERAPQAVRELFN